MSEIFEHFAKVQRAIEDYAKGFLWQKNYLQVNEVAGFIHVDFRASPFKSFFDDLLTILCEAEVASRLESLAFHANDDGANGTRRWNFARIVDSGVNFPNLTTLSVEQYDGLSHNHPIISYGDLSYEEHGILSKWLTKAPNLKFLTAPSAPNSDFFKREACALVVLNIQAGLDTQQFILNFSQSNCFPHLRHFEYRDFDETYLKDYRQQCTPFEHFLALFQSEAFDAIESFTWRNPIFGMDDLAKLRVVRPNLTFRVEHVSYEWIE
ncbi:MAG: hypothetical protein ABI690_05075 [Chloroflexota bacterium]